MNAADFRAYPGMERKMEQSYMLFKAGGLEFMVPLKAVGRIEALDGISGDELPVYDIGILTGKKGRGVRECYVLVLINEKDSFGVLAETIEGIRMVKDDQVLPLGPPVVWKENDYLAGAYLMQREPKLLAYVLDIKKLYERAGLFTVTI